MSDTVWMLTMKTEQAIPPTAKPSFLDSKKLNRDTKDADISTMEMMRSPASYWMSSPASYWMMTPSPGVVDRPYIKSTTSLRRLRSIPFPDLAQTKCRIHKALGSN